MKQNDSTELLAIYIFHKFTIKMTQTWQNNASAFSYDFPGASVLLYGARVSVKDRRPQKNPLYPAKAWQLVVESRHRTSNNESPQFLTEKERKNPEKYSKAATKCDFAGCWRLLDCLYRNDISRITGKLRSIILLHFGRITFRFAYGRDRNSSFLWFRGFWTCPWLPKPIIFIFGKPRIPQIIHGKNRIIFGK